MMNRTTEARYWVPRLMALLAFVVPSLAGAAPAPPAASAAETVVYKRAGERELKLLIDKPAGWKASDKRSAIVFFFGGGWVGGSPEQFRPQSEYFASRGMVGIRVEYRVIPRGDKGPPMVCVQDAKSAMRWVRAHAAELGVDPQRIVGSGGSAGGHLAAFASMVPGLDAPEDDTAVSPRAAALVLFNPVFNNGPGQWGYSVVGERYREFSPAHHITSNAPPAIVFLGTKDALISVKTVEDFQAAMKRAGVRCDAVFYPDQAHGFFNRDPWRTRTLIAADRFLASLGLLEGQPTLSEPPAETVSAPDAKALRK